MTDMVEEFDDSRIFTLPNVISASRLAGVPIFFFCIVTHRYVEALAFLIYAGFSDWADGMVARRFNQYSRFGELLDPSADRLYIATTLVGLGWVGLISWWLVALVILRDAFMIPYLMWLKRRGVVGLPVHFIGKAGTMLLLYSFPVLLLGEVVPALFVGTRAIGWALGLWGVVIYWYAGWLYWDQRKEALQA